MVIQQNNQKHSRKSTTEMLHEDLKPTACSSIENLSLNTFKVLKIIDFMMTCFY